MKKLISCLTAAALCAPSLAAFPVSAGENDDLWERFLRYDLCITDFDALTAEQQELCHFIFDTEQAANDNIVCERARRTLAGDDVGDRLTVEQLENAYGLWDNRSFYTTYYGGWQTYINCVPDVICLNYEFDGNSNDYYNKTEYWIDDERSSYVLFREKVSPDTQSHFEVYDGNDKLIETIPVKYDCPMKDFRGEKEYMEGFGMIEINGGWYYTKPDGTAVFAWSNYSGKPSTEKITEPFVIESEINGCPVKAIEKGALAQTPFTEIVLPDTLECIDQNAFMNCEYLEKIDFPEGLKYIARGAFSECNSMAEITLDCPGLVVAGGAFYDLQSLKTAYINVNDIGERAVSLCGNLESVTLGESVENIRYQAFFGDVSLTDINIPISVKTIGQEALVNLSSVTIPPTIQVIGAYPHKTPQEFTSGIEPPPPKRPLTDEPKCAFANNCVISGNVGSEADRYAEEWGLEFVAVGGVSGDVNGDSSVNMADAVSIMRNTADPDGFPLTVRQKQYADVIGSDGVTNLDALTIQQFEVGIVMQLPVV